MKKHMKIKNTWKGEKNKELAILFIWLFYFVSTTLLQRSGGHVFFFRIIYYWITKKRINITHKLIQHFEWHLLLNFISQHVWNTSANFNIRS